MELKLLIEHLRHGGQIALKSDQQFALGVIATSANPIVSKDLGFTTNSWMCYMASDVMLDNFVGHLPEIGYELLEASENSVDIETQLKGRIHDDFATKEGFVKIRIAKSKALARLIHQLRSPLAVKNMEERDFELVDKTHPCIQVENEDLRELDVIRFHPDASFKLYRKK